MGAPGMSGTHSPALVTRVNEKKAELANLKELRDLSAQLASQMEMLENKLATLADGTQGEFCGDTAYIKCITDSIAIAVVLSNWHNVLGAIQMASSELNQPERGLFMLILPQ